MNHWTKGVLAGSSCNKEAVQTAAFTANQQGTCSVQAIAGSIQEGNACSISDKTATTASTDQGCCAIGKKDATLTASLDNGKVDSNVE